MNAASFDDIHLAQHWLATVHTQESFALSMAKMCGSDFANLILAEARKSKDEQPPRSPEELDLWQRRSTVLKSRISAIAHADSMCHTTPLARDEIIAATVRHCDRPLPIAPLEFEDDLRQAAEFMVKISHLCAQSASTLNR